MKKHNMTLLNLEQLREIEDACLAASIAGDRLVIKRLVEEYAIRAHDLMSRIREGAVLRDHEVIRFASHSLKSSSAALGGQKLADICFRLERAARDNRMIEECLDDIALAEDVLGDTIQALEAHVRSA